MHCLKKITNDLIWVGANDRRLAMFEGVYSVPNGVSYNSYLLTDEKTVLFGTVDKAVQQRFLENVTEALGGRTLDYLIVQHMEPDHSAGFLDILRLYPDMKVVCSAKILAFIKQFYDIDIDARVSIVKEGDTLNTGKHNLHFVMAPMVHWPEVMVVYDSTDKILFSADAFGCFGALNGAIFADEVDFSRDYMDEARRYYTNIVGKYGPQVEALLKKASALEINMICPLHGFVWRKEIEKIIAKYTCWSSYEPEKNGVMIAYASVYGNTENAAEILASRLRDKGIKAVMFDVSVTPASEILAAAFKWSHLVFASTTYNAGIFVKMEELLNDLVSHNIQKRTVAIIENGSWVATSGGLIREKLEECKDITFIDNMLSIKSSLKKAQLTEIDLMAEALITSFPDALKEMPKSSLNNVVSDGSIDPKTMFKLSYGLFVLTAKDDEKENGCITNTAIQITQNPLRISVALNKANFTHDMLVRTKEFNVSVLTESATFDIFERFGFKSGRDTDKFTTYNTDARTMNGIRYLPEHTNAVISAKITEIINCDTHSLFIADVVEAFSLSGGKSLTYQYYFDNIKPKQQSQPKPLISLKDVQEKRKGFICKICSHVYEGDTLSADYVCPICKRGSEDFEPV